MQTKNLSRLRHRRQHVHYILVSRSFQFFLVERVWVWFNCRHVSEDVSMTTRQSWEIFKMAVARPRTMVSESFDSFVAPVINKPVPNHLLETSKCVQKCHCTSQVILKWMLVDISSWYLTVDRLCFAEIYAKVGQNSILQAKPSVIHFTGFQVGEKITRTLVSALCYFNVNKIQFLYQYKIKIIQNGRSQFITL